MQFVCVVCMQAMTHSVDNVPSQRAVKLVVVGLGFVAQYSFRLVCETSYNEKWGELGNGFAIGDANTKNCPLKYLICQTNEESFTFVPSRREEK